MQREIQKTSKILLDTVKDINEEKITISFSGGLDSSLLAFLIKNYSPSVKNIELLYTGMVDTTDYYNSRESAEMLGLELKQHILKRDEIIQSKDRIWEIINSNDLIEASYLLPYYIALKHMENKTMVTGQGADELFMGYNKFLEDKENALEQSKQNYKDLNERVKHREHLLAKTLGKNLILPFINKELEELVLPLPVNYKIQGERVKILLRETAKEIGLPKEISERPKKAAQYGSGVWKVLKKNQK